jgi:chemosensory pili system protein ChpA (sensor histidine kinase/response regulator)
MQTGSELIILLQDDGRGIDTERVRQKAEQLGWITPNQTVSEDALFHFILKPGFSTSEKVTAISGRGVGMDVVSTEIADLGGAFSMESRLHKGAQFKIVLPFTLSLSRVLLFKLQQEWYGLQLANMEGIVRLPFQECEPYITQKTPFTYADREYPLVYLGKLLGLPPRSGNKPSDIVPILLIRVGDKRLACVVDTLVGTREVVIQSVGPQLRAIRVLNGAAILGDGKVVLILDTLHLMDLSGHFAPRLPSTPKANTPPSVLVVDDSPTVRAALSDWLTKQSYAVTLAEDGQIALSKLQNNIPHLMLLDLEMPNMDGFEVITRMRANPAWKNIPIIVISSQLLAKEKVLTLGANQFLGKPYREKELLKAIQEFVPCNTHPY